MPEVNVNAFSGHFRKDVEVLLLEHTRDVENGEEQGFFYPVKNVKIVDVLREELRRRDEELRRRDEELRRRDEELRRRDEELRRRDVFIIKSKLTDVPPEQWSSVLNELLEELRPEDPVAFEDLFWGIAESFRR